MSVITASTIGNWLRHYGVEGMKWGVRRYQNEDGSLTKEGRAHLRGYDSDAGFDTDMGKADQYVNKWMREYGSAPINRLRFDTWNDGIDYGSGQNYVDSYDWNQTSMSDILAAYNDYQNSRKWE